MPGTHCASQPCQYIHNVSAEASCARFHKPSCRSPVMQSTWPSTACQTVTSHGSGVDQAAHPMVCRLPRGRGVRDGRGRAASWCCCSGRDHGWAALRHEAREAVMCFVHSGSAEGGSLIQQTALGAAAATAFSALAAGGGAVGGMDVAASGTPDVVTGPDGARVVHGYGQILHTRWNRDLPPAVVG